MKKKSDNQNQIQIHVGVCVWTILSQVKAPEYVVPLRLFGDGAESYRNSELTQDLTFEFISSM